MSYTQALTRLSPVGPFEQYQGFGITAAITGTCYPNVLESEVVTGGDTIIITLTNDTWVASGATFDAQRQNIIDGITSNQSETLGWNNIVRDTNLAVTDVVRTSSTVVTVTLPANGTYAVTVSETITVTIPASALVSSTSAIVADNTFVVTSAEATTAATQGNRFLSFGRRGLMYGPT